MACVSPRAGYRLPSGRVSFSADLSGGGGKITLPCGQCIACRISKSREWATRCLHESRYHDSSYFLTLTYADNSVYSVSRRDCQLFFKKLRKKYGKFRYFLSAEYGESTSRPHYHMLAFGLNLGSDLHSVESTLVSPQLNEIWGHGHVHIGEVNSTTADYTCKYIIKRVTGPAADDFYRGRLPEFALMSRRPGIGANFISDFIDEIGNAGTVIVHGNERSVPKYYLSKLPEHYQEKISQSKKDFIADKPELKTFRSRRNRQVILSTSSNLKRGKL